jgi:N-methylhydantoinase B
MAAEIDPVLLELLRNELAAVTEEMAIAVEKTARSPLLRMGDFAAVLADRHGRVVGLFESNVMVVVMFRTVLDAVVRRWGDDLAPGDVVVASDPFQGGSHKPDVFVVMPVFAGGQRVGFALTYSHHSDVGGRFPGGISSHTQSTYEEGLHLPNVKLWAGGVRNEALADVLRSNVRVGDEFLADLDAKIAGCWRGAEELRAIVEHHGLATVDAWFDRTIASSERAARAVLAQIPDGEHTATVHLQDDGFGTADADLPVVVTLRFHGDELTVDLAGTAAQVPSAINMPWGNTLAIVHLGLHSILGGAVPFNDGFARPFTVRAPTGTLVNPTVPAAVGGRAPVFFVVTQALHLALAQAVPDRVPVPVNGADVLHVSGTGRDGRPYTLMDIIWGGWGGRPTMDGVDGAASNHYVSLPAEVIEREVPVVVEEFGLVPDTAGAGRYRGGLSVVKRYRFLEDMAVMVRTNQPFGGSPGMAGGHDGAPSQNRLIRADGTATELPRRSHLHLDVRAGDRIHHEVGGVGGHGDPARRDAAHVLADVRAGKLSPEVARRDHGAAVDDPPRG